MAQSRPRTTTPRGTAAKSSESYESIRMDLGPWIETPNSSRVARYRYDYLNDSMQVEWTNGIRSQSGPSSPTAHHATIYGALADGGTPIDYEGFRRFARAVSKGRAVNSILNGFGYRGVSVDEIQASSNPRYRGGSRFTDSKSKDQD